MEKQAPRFHILSRVSFLAPRAEATPRHKLVQLNFSWWSITRLLSAAKIPKNVLQIIPKPRVSKKNQTNIKNKKHTAKGQTVLSLVVFFTFTQFFKYLFNLTFKVSESSVKTCVGEKKKAYSPVVFSPCLVPVCQQGFQEESMWTGAFSLTGLVDLSGQLTHFCLDNGQWKAQAPIGLWLLPTALVHCFCVIPYRSWTSSWWEFIWSWWKEESRTLHLTKVCLKRTFDLASRSDHLLVRGANFNMFSDSECSCRLPRPPPPSLPCGPPTACLWGSDEQTREIDGRVTL